MAEKFTRDDWLILGFAQLAEAGPDGLKLDALCAAAGRTRGSFYHHFDDHDTYRAALWEHWREICVADLLDAFEDLAEDVDRWALLTRLAAGIDPAVEAGVRRAAVAIADAQAATEAVDAARIARLAEIIARQFGCAPMRAADLAEIEYAAFVGRRSLSSAEDVADAPRIGALLAEMVEAAARR